ncbi:MAG: hypothetical protein KME55_31595 [Nostoc indistinguendum CM1-VF10]|nr:hypothetical protein [Nostoc indistinguendum CM1-VF10]
MLRPLSAYDRNLLKSLKSLYSKPFVFTDKSNQLQARSISLWNVYGPTETTIWSLISQVESEEGLISIGRPIANTEVSAICNQFQ